MALSHRRRWGLTPADLDFCSSEREVEIVPLVRLPLTHSNDGVSLPLLPASSLQLVGSQLDASELANPRPRQSQPNGPHFGPFVPPQKAKVPLWFALQLKKKRKCRIVVPNWLSVGTSALPCFGAAARVLTFDDPLRCASHTSLPNSFFTGPQRRSRRLCGTRRLRTTSRHYRGTTSSLAMPCYTGELLTWLLSIRRRRAAEPPSRRVTPCS